MCATSPADNPARVTSLTNAVGFTACRSAVVGGMQRMQPYVVASMTGLFPGQSVTVNLQFPSQVDTNANLRVHGGVGVN